jgi:2'-5' RNA ligase
LLGFTKEKRPFSPHITLGRVRDTASVSQLKECGEVIQGEKYHEKHNLEIDSIKLMRSQLLPTGAVYTELAAVQLP